MAGWVVRLASSARRHVEIYSPGPGKGKRPAVGWWGRPGKAVLRLPAAGRSSDTYVDGLRRKPIRAMAGRKDFSNTFSNSPPGDVLRLCSKSRRDSADADFGLTSIRIVVSHPDRMGKVY